MHTLITAGPTREPLDAVRYLGNRSSGRMGVALAEAAVAMGHHTTLLLGPVPHAPAEHPLLEVVRFETTAQLQALLHQHLPGARLLLMAAAVADFIPEPLADGDTKCSRHAGPVGLTLHPAPDLLQACAASARDDQTCIGFALEPADELLERAAAKLHRKGIDGIVANALCTMDARTISGTLLLADGSTCTAPTTMAKADFATWLLNTLRTELGV